MVRVLGLHAADDGDLVGDSRRVAHQLAEVDPRYLCRDAAEGAGEPGSRERMPALVLADASIQPDQADLFRFLCQRPGDRGIEQASEAGQSAQDTEDTAAGYVVLGVSTGVRIGPGFHQ